MSEDIQQENQLTKFILNYYNWEKEKEQFLQEIYILNANSINKKAYYLIEKTWMNKFKTYIDYDKIKEKIEKETKNNSSINKEEIIKTYIKEDFKTKSNDKETFESLLSFNNYSNDKEIIDELINNKNFVLEIIPEEVKNSLYLNQMNNLKEIKGKKIYDKIIFEIELKDYVIILLVCKEENNVYNTFFIMDNNNNNNNLLINQIEKKKYIDILKSYQIKLINVNENDGFVSRDLISDKIRFTIVIKIIKKIENDNISSLLFSEIDNYSEKKLSNENTNRKITQFLITLSKSDDIFNRALNIGEIRSNYTPCKIIDKEWMEQFKNIFKYHYNKDFKIGDNYNKNDYNKLITKLPVTLTKEKIEKGIFYILDENSLLNLFPLIKIQEDDKENFKDYQIFLNNNKGAIIINDNIYIFETKGNINSRFNYEKIKSQKKYELLYKMSISEKYELTKENWEILKSNVNEQSIIEKKDTGLNEDKRNCKINEEINTLLDLIRKKENELEIQKQNLIKKEKELNKKLNEINKNNKVVLKKNIPTLGLENLGATCYMNATLQCMAHFSEVSEKILTWYKYSKDNNKKSRKISYAYAEVLDNLYSLNDNMYHNSNKTFYAPQQFKNLIGNLNPLFQGIQANDSKDLLNFMIEKMHEELNPLGENNLNNNNINDNMFVDQTDELLTYNNFKNDVLKNYHSILSDYLYGIQKTVTVCCNCGSMIFNFQLYNFLIFPLLEVKNYVINNNCQNPFFNMQNYIINIYDCFKYFQKIDFFTGQNQIYCNKCNYMNNANYCTLLHTVPTILCIVLNRGKDNKDFREKINFNNKLDLSTFIQDKNDYGLYYLIGVVVHLGDSSMNGHFFAYCRSHFNSPWYNYNDSIVRLCQESDIFSVGTPYILFYHKFQ